MIVVGLALGAAPPDSELYGLLVDDAGVRDVYEEARAAEAAGRLAEASSGYRVVAARLPGLGRSALDVARIEVLRGRPDAALAVYEASPYDPDLAEAHGRLLLDLGRPDEAALVFRRLRDLRPEWPGARLLEARARAGSEPDLAAGLLEEALELDGLEPDGDGLDGAVVATVTALASTAQHSAAKGLLLDVLARFPDREALRPELAALEVDEQARALAVALDVPLAPAQVAALRSAREAFAAGDVEAARSSLEALVEEAPGSASAWATLSDVRAAQGDLAGAEQAVEAASRLEPLEPAHLAKLAGWLGSHYGGRYDADAAELYARAVARRADDPALWAARAGAERRAGLWSRAEASYQRVAGLDPRGPLGAEARAALAELRRSRPPPVALPTALPPPDVPEEAWLALHRARAWRDRSEPEAMDRAAAEVARARALAPGLRAAIELDATFAAERGDLTAAVAGWEESDRLAPGRGETARRLADLYRRAGRLADADAAERRAAELGDPGALLALARAHADAWRWGQARRALAQLFSRATSGPDWEAAQALDDDLVSRQRRAAAGSALVVVGVVAAGLGAWVRARSGSTVAELLAVAPHAERDVARIASAVRHEVLKHHAAALHRVADAAERGDLEPARWLAERLYGAEGPLERLGGFVRELEALARSNGVRLNLRRRDPVFGPMLRAFRRLERLRGPLSTGAVARVAPALRQVGEALSGEAWQRLGELVNRLSVQAVDEAAIRELWASVQAEPAFEGLLTPSLAVEAPLSLRVRIWRSDRDTVLQNLLRNALAASLASGEDEVGVAIGVEEDPVTAVERVVVRVRDRARGTVTTAQIRARAVTRGLGLALDLAARAGGSLHVEPEPGWSKAVVFRLPRAE